MTVFKSVILGCCLSVFLAGCASNVQTNARGEVLPPLPEWEVDGLSTRTISPNRIYKLTPKQEREFLTYFKDPAKQHIDDHQRLANFLTEYMESFSYSGTTKTASEAMASKTGDCVSLAILTSALARLAGVRYLHRKVIRAPIYTRSNDIIITAQHIRTVLFKSKENLSDNAIEPWTKYIYIDYYRADTDIPAEPITWAHFDSLFYSNLSATYLTENKLIEAYAYSRKALELAPDNPENINQHAVILKRLGYAQKALALYEYGFNYFPDSINLLSNYKVLLERQGNEAMIAKVDAKLLNIKDSNPYQWLQLGYDAYDQEEYSRALQLFKRAEDKARYLDYVYLALAKASYSLGKRNDAKLYLEKALAAPVKANSEQLLAGKLASL